MTPNTLRIALGLLLFGAAPVAITAFPQQAISDSHSPAVEQPAEMEQPVEEDMEPAAEAEQPATAELSIAEIAASGEDFTILTAAIEAAGLTEVLNNSDLSVTVFAPTDAAFEALPEGTLEALLLPENRDQLTQLLTYHVVDGEVRSTDLADGEVETISGSPVMVMVGDEAVTINEANVVMADIEASNGVIHVIDAVLMPL
ncbi:fasciclin domain-containing protein [Nodosilinea sp. E11]|uniref:fasciclin domain-containing protein n=1 Tax=Nodosilinea sp. E11 TaxID=3037479 RepID=UPI002934189D|nr:fasciclin domain-containing protein [Nodosilinea sp. E11]WOD40730.1 fasciclin domain-containing protein [Nodosilinea sp. E11]